MNSSLWLAIGAAFSIASGLVGALVKYLTGQFNGQIAELRHRLNNERQRTDSLEHFRTEDVQRIAKLESNYESLKDDNRDIKAMINQVLTALNAK